MDGHAGHPGAAPPREPMPPVTAADRAAAFPQVAGHTVHDQAVHTFSSSDSNGGTRTGAGRSAGT